MCLLRLKEPYDTDILLSLYIPDKYNEDADGNVLANPGESETYKDYVKQTQTLFRKIVASFQIASDQSMKDLLGMWLFMKWAKINNLIKTQKANFHL